MTSANLPAIGRKASAACAEVWMSVLPEACERSGSGKDNRQRDQVGECHADDGVGTNAIEFLSRAIVPVDQRLLARIDPLLFGLLRGLPEEQIGRDRGAEDRDDGGEVIRAPGQFRDQHAGQCLAPRNMCKGQCGDVGEQAERQPFQHRYVAFVVHEDLRDHRRHAKEQDVEDGMSTNQKPGGVRHGGEVGCDIDGVGDGQHRHDGGQQPGRIMPAHIA